MTICYALSFFYEFIILRKLFDKDTFYRDFMKRLQIKILNLVKTNFYIRLIPQIYSCKD